MGKKKRTKQGKARNSRAGTARTARGAPAAGQAADDWRAAVRTLTAERPEARVSSGAREAGTATQDGESSPDDGAGTEHPGPGQAPLGGCDGLLAEAEPQVVAATYWYQPGTEVRERPFDLEVRFTGVRMGVSRARAPRDRFERVERVEAIPPRSGPIAVTTHVEGVNPGRWRVTTAPVRQPGRPRRETITTHSRFRGLAQGPQVRLWAWPTLIGIGAVVAIALQALLAADAGLDVLDTTVLSLVACVIGILGGKAWYLAQHRAHPRTALTAGMCVQGFLVGAIATLVVGAALVGVPIASLLDITTPGILFAVAIGRPGCFLTGCCAGRPTGSRWGLRSSDRRLLIRRAPVQLTEALLGLTLAVVSLALVLSASAAFPGQVFIAMLAAYTLGRQPLFLMRADSHTPRGRAVTIAVCAAVIVTDVAVPLLV